VLPRPPAPAAPSACYEAFARMVAEGLPRIRETHDDRPAVSSISEIRVSNLPESDGRAFGKVQPETMDGSSERRVKTRSGVRCQALA